jgi:hypothetical protein
MDLEILMVDRDGGNVNGDASSKVVAILAVALRPSHWISLKTSQEWEDSGLVART